MIPAIAIFLGLGLALAASSSSSPKQPSYGPSPGGGPPPGGGVPGGAAPSGIPMDKAPPFGSFTSCDAALQTLDKVSPGIAATVTKAMQGADATGLETVAKTLDAAAIMYAPPTSDAAKVVAQCIRLRIAEIKAGKTTPGAPSWWNAGGAGGMPMGKDLIPIGDAYPDANGGVWNFAQTPEGITATPDAASWALYQARGAGVFPPELVSDSVPDLLHAIEEFAAQWPNAPGVLETPGMYIPQMQQIGQYMQRAEDVGDFRARRTA